MKSLLTILLSVIFLAGLPAQEKYIELSTGQNSPSYKVEGNFKFELLINPFKSDNLLRLYDANPFQQPVIRTRGDVGSEVGDAFMAYLEEVGFSHSGGSSNKIHLKVDMLSVNYLLGKGWTSTVKLGLQVNSGSRSVYGGILSGYNEAGGGEGDLDRAEVAVNGALLQAFESINWKQLSDSFSSSGPPTDAARDYEITGSRVSGSETGGSASQKKDEPAVRGRYFALVIAIEDYLYLTPLDQPLNDAMRLIKIITSSYSFNQDDIIFLQNPTREEIIDKLDELVKTVKSIDNLLIFYAGHGYWDEERGTGYWLPVDARKESTANWLRNSTIQEYIGDIKSKHTLLIADACFGGGIFKTRKAFNDAPSSINQMYDLSSRKAITSGMLNEVPDHSVFFDYLIKRLEDNSERYISSLELFSSFRTAVMNNSDNVPQYGTIQKAGDEGGDFIFIRSR